MATAKKVPVQNFDVELTLSYDEASALSRVLACVGGDPATTRRGLIAEINSALSQLGFHDRKPDHEGYTRFK